MSDVGDQSSQIAGMLSRIESRLHTIEGRLNCQAVKGSIGSDTVTLIEGFNIEEVLRAGVAYLNAMDSGQTLMTNALLDRLLSEREGELSDDDLMKELHRRLRRNVDATTLIHENPDADGERL